MTGTLIFSTAAEMARTVADRDAMEVRSASRVPEMLRHIAAGGTAVAILERMSTGFRLPEGARVEFTAGCTEDGPHRVQAESRARSAEASGPKLRPYQQALVDRIMSGGAESLRLVSRHFRPGRPQGGTILQTDLAGRHTFVDEFVASVLGDKAAHLSGDMEDRLADESHHIKADVGKELPDDIEP